MDDKECLTTLLDTNCGYVDEIPADEMADCLIAAGVALPVRCKECKYYKDDDCSLQSGLLMPAPADFCSYGERRADG